MVFFGTLSLIYFCWSRWSSSNRAAGTHFNIVRTDPLEMDHLVSSDPLFPNNLPPYVVYHSDFNATEKYHTYLGKDSKKFKITRKKSNCYHKYAFTTAYFCIMKHKKMKQTNWTQMFNKKSTDTP